MQQSELRVLLADCTRLWGTTARLEPAGDGIALDGPAGRYVLSPAPAADRPIRWHLTRPDGRVRPLPSIVPALTVLHNAMAEA